MEYKKVHTTIDTTRAKYDDWLQRAIDKLEITIDNISYIALLDEDTNKPINNDLINEINDIIYKIEELKEKPIMKPFSFKNKK
nr:MAG TPA: hypothetical protein [Caudoviricetes sp.]